MGHGIVDVFAFQEALLIEAVLGIALLTMIWVGFRRWLQHKEKMGRLIAAQTAERAALNGTNIDRVEARLTAIEQMLTDIQPVAQIELVAPEPLGEPIVTSDKVRPKT